MKCKATHSELLLYTCLNGYDEKTDVSGLGEDVQQFGNSHPLLVECEVR